jgi:hypothetical protein
VVEREALVVVAAMVLLEYAHLWATLANVQLRPLESDRLVWRWTADGQYSVRSAYRAYFSGWTTLVGAKELWRANVPSKVKFFFWLALHGRLWTAERRRRHGLQPCVTCALCDQLDETTDHLLCSCVFSREVWSCLLLAMNSLAAPPQLASSLLDWWLSERDRLPQALRTSFDFLVLLVTWCLWKERNRRTFDRRSVSPNELITVILKEVAAWVGTGFGSLALLTGLVP